MIVDSYTITGTGPGGANFSQTVTSTSTSIPNLKLGSWTILVQALNATPTVIGSGQASVSVTTGSNPVSITVTPVTGTGTLSLGVTWPSSVVTNPSLTATLTPPGGGSSNLPMVISGSQALYTASLPNGYNTLSLALSDNGTLITTAVDVVRIVAGQVTSGTYAFTNVNLASGTATITVTQNLMNPLLATISGAPATQSLGTSSTLTASVSNYTGSINYTWYVNGVPSGTGPSFPFGISRGVGTYLITLTAFSADGTQAGSASATVQIVTGTFPGLAGTVTTLAGATTAGSANGTGTSARFSAPSGAVTDLNGNVYIADTTNNMIRKINVSTGVVTTVAGSTTAGSADGTGTAASFRGPIGIATDGTNLYIADTSNNMIRKIVISTGVVTTLAGSTTAGTTNSTGPAARFRGPTGLATDGVNLYVADKGNNRIRKVVISTGVVTTLAGAAAGSANGTGTAATFSSPSGIAIDGSNLYVADTSNNMIRQIVIGSAVVTTLAGATTSGSTNGTGTAARFSGPTGVTSDGTNLYVADRTNKMIRKLVTATGVVTTLAGSTTSGSVNGTGTAARFNAPYAVSTDGLNVYVADTTNNMIRQIQ